MRELLCMGWTDSDRDEKNKDTEETSKREGDSNCPFLIGQLYMRHNSENCTHMNMHADCI